ncbi:MAG TPA: extracellular solute-binding protein [Ardenticatenaceae bacterium]|nr:extracellular solute-binding protein [Ardenticatenaceae bacterium]
MKVVGLHFRLDRRRIAVVVMLLVLVVVAGCQERSDGRVETPTPLNTATPQEEVAPPPTPTPGVVELVVWSPAALSPRAEEDAGALLARQIASFEAAHPSITVRYEPKAAQGESGLLQFLRAASTVAPGALPDVIIFPSDDFDDAAQAELLAPLDSLIAPDVVQAMYPFAQRGAMLGDRLLALPLVVTVEHIVYRARGAEPPPRTWAEFLGGQQRLLFAAGRDGQVNDAIWLQLLAVTSDGASDGEMPEVEALRPILEFFAAGRSRGLISPNAAELSDASALWALFVDGQAELLEIDARTFMTRRDRLEGLEYTHVPTRNGLPLTVAAGYLVAVTTNDPLRQQAAAAYLGWLLAPEQLAPYAAVTGWLPPRPDALDAAVADEGYRRFLDGLLGQARLRPGDPQWTAVSEVVEEQVRAVLLGERTADEAVEVLHERLR